MILYLTLADNYDDICDNFSQWQIYFEQVLPSVEAQPMVGFPGTVCPQLSKWEITLHGTMCTWNRPHFCNLLQKIHSVSYMQRGLFKFWKTCCRSSSASNRWPHVKRYQSWQMPDNLNILFELSPGAIICRQFWPSVCHRGPREP